MNLLTVTNARALGLRALVASILVLALSGCATTNADGTTNGFMGLTWWAWLVVAAILLGLLWWLMSRNRASGQMTDREKARMAASAPPKPTPPAAPTVAATTTAATAATAAAATPAVVPDDLTKIEGIGPKINTVLHAGGIMTYEGLAKASRDQLEAILGAADIHGSYGDPTTWPAQAELAAAGKWDELKAMQDTLKGGRMA